MRKIIFLIFLLVWSRGVFPQDKHVMDSLQNVLNHAGKDTVRVKALNSLGWNELLAGSREKGLAYANEALILSKEIGYLQGEANSLHNIGQACSDKGSYKEAVENYLASLKINERLDNKKAAGKNLANIGIAYKVQGNYPLALDYYLKAQKLFEETKDLRDLSNVLGNIGSIYRNQTDYPRALEYFLKSMRLSERLGDKPGIAANYSRMGLIYNQETDYPMAIEYYSKSLKMNQELGRKKSIALDMGNIGVAYFNLKDYTKAREYMEKAYGMDKELGNKKGMAQDLGNLGSTYGMQLNYTKALDCFEEGLKLDQEIHARPDEGVVYGNIAGIYIDQKKYADAEKYLQKSLAIAKEIGSIDQAMVQHQTMVRLYEEWKKPAEALLHYKEFVKARDTVFSGENTRKSVQLEMKFVFGKKQTADSVKNAAMQKIKDVQIQLQNAQIKQDRTRRYALYGGLALIALFAGFMFNRFRVTQKQKVVIEMQKDLVEEKQKEIVDSINYAKRIQGALLASDHLLKNNLEDYFVLYKPKDIVSGDFYWASDTLKGKTGSFLFCMADCTGHGVPGAFMSLLNISKLNEAVNQQHLEKPDLILNAVRTEIIRALNPEGSQVMSQDGMDAVLVSVDKTRMQLSYAAANTSLYIIRNKTLIICNPDKMPVGKSPGEEKPFTLHEVPLLAGDRIYIFTDGYADQFGGEKGKKFKYKQLEAFLLEIAALPMEEQKQLLSQRFETWKGGLEQVDDVCGVGISVG